MKKQIEETNAATKRKEKQGMKMQDTVRVLVTVMAAGLFWASQASAALIVNGDAETGNLTGWSGGAPATAQTNDVFAGTYSFKVDRTNPAAGAFQHFGTDGTFAVNPSQVYQLDFEYKVTANTSGDVPAAWISEFSPENDHMFALSPTIGGWTHFSKRIGPSVGFAGADVAWTNPLSTSGQLLFFAINSGVFDAGAGTGTILLDNISFEIVPIPEPSILSAGSLGLGILLGWRKRRSRV